MQAKNPARRAGDRSTVKRLWCENGEGTEGRHHRGICQRPDRFFRNADDEIKELAKTASDALEQRNYALAINCVNQLFANAVKLNADQFMVASETMVNIQQALIEAAEGGDKKAQWLLNTMVDTRRG